MRNGIVSTIDCITTQLKEIRKYFLSKSQCDSPTPNPIPNPTINWKSK